MTASGRTALSLPGLWMLSRRYPRAHLVGIAGSGMAALAEVLCASGMRVSGSDRKAGRTAAHLRSLGVRVHGRHAAAHVPPASLLVHTAAVTGSHPEVAAARRRRQPVLARGELLAGLMRGSCGVAVAGAHGKSTTAGMAALGLSAAGLSPWAAIGARLPGRTGHALLGGSPILVAEVDESDGTLDRVDPWVLVVTNVDREHLDRFGGSFAALEAAFRAAAARVPAEGVVVTGDDAAARRVTARTPARRVLAGLAADCQVRGEGLELVRGCARFSVRAGGRRAGRVALRVPGLMNAGNALLAIGVCLSLGAPFADVARGLGDFTGMGRRFEILGSPRGIHVVDDYAHHPREIAATLLAARAMFPQRRIVVLFEPHRPSRLRALLPGFVRALAAADAVVVAPLFGAFEVSRLPAPAAMPERLAGAIAARGPSASAAASTEDAVSRACAAARRGDVLLVMGAGEAEGMAQRALEALSTGGRA